MHPFSDWRSSVDVFFLSFFRGSSWPIFACPDTIGIPHIVLGRVRSLEEMEGGFPRGSDVGPIRPWKRHEIW